MGKREENKRKKRARLEAEGLRLFLQEGYDRASIEQIASSSEVARGTFYLYFPDKRALFETLIDRWFILVVELLEHVAAGIAQTTDPEQALAIYEEMGTGLALIALTHQEEFLLTFRENRRPGEAGQLLRIREQQLLRLVGAFTEEAVRRELIQLENPTLTVLMIFGAIERIFYEFLEGTPLGSAEEMGLTVVRMFGRAMALPVTD